MAHPPGQIETWLRQAKEVQQIKKNDPETKNFYLKYKKSFHIFGAEPVF